MAGRIWRLWGVRHVRWIVLSWRVHKAALDWAEVGIGLGHPHPSDLRVIDAIWKGER